MQEQRISFETAKLASESGYNNGCEYIYTYPNGELKRCAAECYNTEMDGLEFEAPTQGMLQKWLREKYNIHINITKVYECNTSPAKFCGWNIYIAGKDFETVYDVNSELISKYFNSYEEALEFGLQEALKLI